MEQRGKYFPLLWTLKMKTIYEKEIETEEGKTFVECDEEDATHVHYCMHDEGKPCKRVLK